MNEVVNHFLNDEAIAQKIIPFKINIEEYFKKASEVEFQYDFKDVKGQQKAKLANECLLIEVHTVAYKVFLPKKLNLNLIT